MSNARAIQRWGAWLVSAVVVVLALLALDDITTGREPSHALEWTMVVAAAVWFAALTVARWRRPREPRTPGG